MRKWDITHHRSIFWLALLAWLLPACNLAVPQVTPTVAPTLVPSETPMLTSTPTRTLPVTATFPPTNTLVPSQTFPPSTTPTGIPSLTYTLVPSWTPTLSPSSTQTPPPTIPYTDTPTFTRSPVPVPPTLTLPPSPTPGVAPAGVREPTAEIITAAPETIAAQVTPFEVVETPALASQTAIPQPSEAPLLPSPLPPIGAFASPFPDQPQLRGFALSASGGILSGEAIQMPFGATTFARNPFNPSQYAVVDERGLLYLFDGGLDANQGVLMATSPFALPEPLTREANNAIVTQVAWSPDGQTLAFLVDAERDDRDGIWVMPNGQPARQIFRECPPPLLDRGLCTIEIGGEPSRINSLRFDWSPDSSAVLVTLFLPDETRRAFTVVPLSNPPTNLPPILRYDYASWSQDGSKILVSGAAARDNRVALRRVDPLTDAQQIIFDATAAGLWLQNAVERPGGQIVALGSPGGAGSPMSLYDGSGQPLTPQIGTTAPNRVTWSPDRSAVLVVTNDVTTRHYYVAEVTGAVREITEQVAGALAVEWLDGVPQPDAPTTAPPTPIPATIVPPQTLAPVGQVVGQGNYGISVNQQVQVISPAGARLRAAPSVNGEELAWLTTYEYVTVIGGPTQADGLTWWEVETGGGQTGWMAESDGFQQLLSLTPLPGEG